MTIVGTYHAKTHFAELMERVRRGEEILITRRGVPIMHWIPHRKSAKDLKEVFRKMTEIRRGNRLGRKKGESLRDLMHEGHRYY